MKNLLTENVDLLRQNARSVVRELGLLNDAYFEIGVTLAERHLLIELANWACPTVGEIAERLLLDKSTVSRLIAKATKKGYVKSSSEEKDKRKRFLHLTELGKRTLESFEPIAFSQTKEALETLEAEEIELVYRGVALYAKGLKNARLQNRSVSMVKSEAAAVEMGREFAALGLTLKPFRQEDEKALYEIFREVVDSGDQFPYESNSIQEFYRQFLHPQSQVYVCHKEGEVVGSFYVRSNFSGRSGHIANGAYMIKKDYQGQGIGTLLIHSSLSIAKNLGFQAMQFNRVLSQNERAVKLYQKLGFKVIGTIPEAVRNPDGTYQDCYIFYRKLDT